MKTRLNYFLNKNNITLKYFCDINKVKSYEALCLYCEKKNLIPVDQQFYNENIPSKSIIKKKTNEAPKKKSSTPGRSRKTSKVTKKRPVSTKDNS